MRGKHILAALAAIFAVLFIAAQSATADPISPNPNPPPTGSFTGPPPPPPPGCAQEPFITCYTSEPGDVLVPAIGHGTGGTDFLESVCTPPNAYAATSQIELTKHTDGTVEIGQAGAWWWTTHSAYGPARFRIFERPVGSSGWTFVADSGPVKQSFGHDVAYWVNGITGAQPSEEFVVNIYYLGVSLDGSDGSYLCQTPILRNPA